MQNTAPALGEKAPSSDGDRPHSAQAIAATGNLAASDALPPIKKFVLDATEGSSLPMIHSARGAGERYDTPSERDLRDRYAKQFQAEQERWYHEAITKTLNTTAS